MDRKQLLWIAIFAAATLAVSSIAQVNVVSAQQDGDAGFGGAGGAGGSGGGGGGSFGGWNGSGGVAAYGEYVYVLHQGRLYQYAAYDLTLVKKITLKDNGAKSRNGRRQLEDQRRGRFGGGQGGDGGRGGEGGHGGGFDFGGGFGRSNGVAAHGEYIYVLEGGKLQKLAVDGLASVKTVTLESDFKTRD